MNRRTRALLIFASILALLGVFAPANAQAARYAYHKEVGSTQAFATVYTGGAVCWIYQGQSTSKCPGEVYALVTNPTSSLWCYRMDLGGPATQKAGPNASWQPPGGTSWMCYTKAA